MIRRVIPRGRHVLCGILFLVVVAVEMNGSAAAQAQGRAFSAFPAFQFQRGGPDRNIDSVVVTNTTRQSYRVKVFPALLGQLVSGGFTVRERPGDLPRAERVLRVTPQTFVIRPATRRSISVRWIGIPPKAASVAATVVVEGQPAAVEGSGVGTKARILTLAFLRARSNPKVPARFTSLRGEQTGPRKLQIVSGVENRGRDFATPRSARITVRDARGRQVFRRGWGGQQLDVVIGGYEREFPVPVTKILPAGRYRLRTEMLFAGKRYVREAPMVLTGPNEIPTTNGRLLVVTGRGDPGEPAQMTIKVANTGTVAITPVLDIGLARLRTKTAPRATVARRVVRGERLAPGKEATIETSLGKLVEGRHEAFVTLKVGERELDRGSAPIVSVPPRTFWQEFREFLREHKILLIVLGVLLVLALAAFLQRRRIADWRRRSAQAAVISDPAAAPPTGKVDLNTATVEELQRLPGVGPRAAARIVERREEYGRFSSVDELEAVEGFDHDRIAALRDLVRV